MDKRVSQTACPVCGEKEEFVTSQAVVALAACATCGTVKWKFDDSTPVEESKLREQCALLEQENSKLKAYAGYCSKLCSEAATALISGRIPRDGIHGLKSRLNGVVNTVGNKQSLYLRKLQAYFTLHNLVLTLLTENESLSRNESLMGVLRELYQVEKLLKKN